MKSLSQKIVYCKESIGNRTRIFIKKGDDFFARGANIFNELDVKSGSKDIKTMQQVQTNNIIKIVCADNCVFQLREDGSVWMNNLHNKSFPYPEENSFNTHSNFVKVEELNNIIDVVCNSFSLLALRKDGKVFAWGDNYTNLLGFSDRNIVKPILIPNISDIKEVAMGNSHSLLLTTAGEVLYSGVHNTKFEMIGPGHKRKFYNLSAIGVSNIKKIFASTDLSFFLNENDSLFGLGNSHFLNIWNDQIYDPDNIHVHSFCDNVKDIYFSTRYGIILFKNGTLGYIGKNLFFNKYLKEQDFRSLTPLEFLKNDNIEISCSYNNILILKKDLRVIHFQAHEEKYRTIHLLRK